MDFWTPPRFLIIVLHEKKGPEIRKNCAPMCHPLKHSMVFYRDTNHWSSTSKCHFQSVLVGKAILCVLGSRSQLPFAPARRGRLFSDPMQTNTRPNIVKCRFSEEPLGTPLSAMEFPFFHAEGTRRTMTWTRWNWNRSKRFAAEVCICDEMSSDVRENLYLYWEMFCGTSHESVTLWWNLIPFAARTLYLQLATGCP